jgi:hypothetical protein
LVKHNFRLAEDAGAITTTLLARTEEEGTIQSMIEKHQALADAETAMEHAVKIFAHDLPKIPLHATVAQQLKYNAAVAEASERYAASDPNIRPEQVKEFQQKLAVAKPPVFNFSNSRFDIRQNFAEGFDPDRIAVAFTNDLAMLGERRLQSGLAPVYAAR